MTFSTRRGLIALGAAITATVLVVLGVSVATRGDAAAPTSSIAASSPTSSPAVPGAPGVSAAGPQGLIGLGRAEAVAAQVGHGHVIKAELQQEAGASTYKVDVRAGNGTTAEVTVDAYTGRVLERQSSDADSSVDEGDATAEGAPPASR